MYLECNVLVNIYDTYYVNFVAGVVALNNGIHIPNE